MTDDHLRNMLRKSAFDFGASPPLALVPLSPAGNSPSFSFAPVPAGFTNFIGCSLTAAWPLAVLLVASTRGVNANWDLEKNGWPFKYSS